MSLPVRPPFPPMEARSADALPAGDGWTYEPKWDGFRCLVFKDGDGVELQSKALKPLGRYFPEVLATFAGLEVPRLALDGELVVPVEGLLSFDDLLMRIHPAESRVATLAAATPAAFVAFDLLVDPEGASWVDRPLVERRAALEAVAARVFAGRGELGLSPVTDDRAVAERWLAGSGGGLDGVVAKRADAAYDSGGRGAMVKVKRYRSADCVVGGFRYGTDSDLVGSLLLGLYDDDGRLHHVGFTSGIRAEDREWLTERLEGLVGGEGFTGRAPGGPSRWSTERSAAWEPLAPELVVEVAYDHVTRDRFRHGTRILRWRPDKLPEQCTLDQIGGGGARWEEVLTGG